MGFDNPYDVDRAGMRAAFQRRLFVEKRAWESNREAFLTDRSTFDNLAYLTMHGGAESLSHDDVDAYVEAMRRYTLVVYLPIRCFHHVGGDPARVASATYHQLYDVLLRALLKEFRVAHETLDVPIEERAKVLDRWVA